MFKQVARQTRRTIQIKLIVFVGFSSQIMHFDYFLGSCIYMNRSSENFQLYFYAMTLKSKLNKLTQQIGWPFFSYAPAMV